MREFDPPSHSLRHAPGGLATNRAQATRKYAFLVYKFAQLLLVMTQLNSGAFEKVSERIFKLGGSRCLILRCRVTAVLRILIAERGTVVGP